jgi:putative transposase
MIVHHPEYMKLGADPDTRSRAYRELFRYQIPDHDIHLIENASEYCHPVGDDRFREEIEKRYGIDLGRASRGRPKKMTDVITI